MNEALAGLATGIISAMWKLYEEKYSTTTPSAREKQLEDLASHQKALIDKARIYCNWAEGQLKAKDAELVRLTELVEQEKANPSNPLSVPVAPIPESPY